MYILVASLIFLPLLLCLLYVKRRYDYWDRKNIPYLRPTFPLGNSKTVFPKGISIGIISKYFYDVFKTMGCKVGGVYIGLRPNLVLVEPNFIKDVLTKDFRHFVDRGVYQNENDPISVNIFSQPGPEWKKTRSKLTNTFTSSKMKSMFPIVSACCEALDEVLETFCRDESDVDALEVFGCLTTDVIGSCAFGISCNSFQRPDAEFRRMGRKVFQQFNLSDQLNLFLSLYAPSLAQILGVRNIQKDVSKFFFASVKDTVAYREKNNVHRNDFLQLMIEMKNSEVGLSMNELTAQAFLFFLAAFETSSTTITMSLYEMGRNQEAQNRIRDEVLQVVERHNGEITYEAVAEMTYLGQAMDETLRIWPPVTTLTRVCTEDYRFANSNVTVEKGVPVLIAVLGLQRDPEYWPDPLRWDPDRFGEANKGNRKPFTYLPFGEGPRNCIGLRFGVMQTKLALATVLRKYRVYVSPKTVSELDLDPDTFLLHTTSKVYLNFEKIN